MDGFQPEQQERYCGVLIKPDKDEKRSIRRRYLKVGLVICLNVFLFNIVLLGLVYLIGGITEGDLTSISAINNGTAQMLTEHPFLRTVISCLIPVISELCAIIFGIKMLKLDIKKLFNRDNYSGGDIVRLSTVSLGLQTAAALIAYVVTYILSRFHLESATVTLDINSQSLAATLILYFYACLLGPLLEELLYRGVILHGLSKYNQRFAVIISALIFGIMHQNYQQFFLGFLVGLVLGAVTLRTKSIIPSLVAHIIINTTGVLSGLILQYADNNAYAEIMANNGIVDITSLSSSFIVAIMINALFRYGFLFAAIILLVISMVKCNTVKKPTPAGKSRGWPILAQSLIWYVILIVYIYLTFISPMQKIK